MDVNLWGLICVPLGILVLFGPILYAAVRTKPGEPYGTDKTRKD